MPDATAVEDLMTVQLGKEVADRAVIHCGAFTPLVLASGMWALAHHAPNAVIVPISVSSVRTFTPFPITYSLLEGMALTNGLQYPMTDVFTHVEGLSGCGYEPVNPLQVDRSGNVNLSVLGSYHRPDFRGPGPAGMDILSIMEHDTLIIYLTRHSTRTIVNQVDFVTGIGNDQERRAKHHVPQGGVKKIITNLCVFTFDANGEAVLESTHPWASFDDVRDNTGFPVRWATEPQTTPEPTEAELAVLERIDPLRIRRFEFMSARQRRAALPDLIARERAYFESLTAAS